MRLELTAEEATFLQQLANPAGVAVMCLDPEVHMLARLVQRIYAAASPEPTKLDSVRCPVCGMPTDYHGCATGKCRQV